MKHALSHERIITLEDNVLAGGFGSAVVEFLQDSNIQTPVLRIGWPDKFIPHGTDVEALRRLYGLDFQGILNKVLPHLSPDINSAKMVERT
jgi:1-deoxy-D-xylulose-5-phosphate synthase